MQKNHAVGIGGLKYLRVNRVSIESDPIGFDPIGFDPIGFDPIGFDPIGFDPIGFDPIGFNRVWPHWLNDIRMS